MKDIPITAARHELTSLPRRFAKEPGTVTVTRRGKPVLAIMSWELYESLMETLEIMGDKEFMTKLRRGIQEMKEDKGIPWDEVKKELDL